MIVGYYKNYLYTTDKVSSEKKKKKNNEESQYMVSHPETGSDWPIGSNQDRGRDRIPPNNSTNTFNGGLEFLKPNPNQRIQGFIPKFTKLYKP